MQDLRCGSDLALTRPLLAVDATLEPALNGWRGHSAMRLAGLAAGGQRIDQVAGRVTFAGDMARTEGTLDLEAASTIFSSARTGRIQLEGRYDLSPDNGTIRLAADVDAAGLSLAEYAVTSLSENLRSVAATRSGRSARRWLGRWRVPPKGVCRPMPVCSSPAGANMPPCVWNGFVWPVRAAPGWTRRPARSPII